MGPLIVLARMVAKSLLRSIGLCALAQKLAALRQAQGKLPAGYAQQKRAACPPLLHHRPFPLCILRVRKAVAHSTLR